MSRSDPRPAGFPEVTRVAVGRLTGIFGVRGEIKCRPAPSGAQAFAGGSFALLLDGAERTVRCRGARRHHERLLLSFEGVDTPEAARALVGGELFGECAVDPLASDEYLDVDLIGLRLVDEDGHELARVIGVEHYPAQDCLVVEPGNALVPLVKAFVRGIDIGAGTILTTLPAGLLD